MNNATEEMKHLHKLAKRDPRKRFNHLWETLTDPQWLMQAWEEIRRNKGSMTPGVSGTTAVDMDPERIKKLAKRLRANRYRPTPVRRTHIPKANGKKRPLGIPDPEDKTVQQGLKMLLEPIFEADFLPCSHGFRPKRSTHTALRDVSYAYPRTSWIIEWDIEGCFDNISHGKLMKAIAKRIADGKIRRLIKRFLEAGYLEDWKYHRTYSGTPQGGVLSPLLANIFLHQLDEYMVKTLGANETQAKRVENARRNPEYRRIENKITRLRRRLRQIQGAERVPMVRTLIELERQQKRTAYYAKELKHPSTLAYIRYADDSVSLVQGRKEDAERTVRQVEEELKRMDLTLSASKTKTTHWHHWVTFLGYDIRGARNQKGVGIHPILKIPRQKLQRIKDALRQVGGYHNIPETDIILQMNAMYRGWGNYYRYARAPQRDFSSLASYMWWQYAHYLARKQRSSVKKTIRREKRAGRLQVVSRKGRKRRTFQTKVKGKTLRLDLFPPKTEQIRALSTKTEWTVDLQPVIPTNWQSGRSLATRLAALERSKGVCERCQERPVAVVHHRIRLQGKSFLARVMSDSAQRYTATALCKECHLEVHGGSFKPRRQRSTGKAGYAERCLSGLGSAS
jgi:group II intron reverse transcriptase/maturase